MNMKSIVATLFMSFCLLSQQAIGISFANLDSSETITPSDSRSIPCNETKEGMRTSNTSSFAVSHYRDEALETSSSNQAQGQDCCEQDCQCCTGCGLSFINDRAYRLIKTSSIVSEFQNLSQTPQSLPQLLFRPPIRH